MFERIIKQFARQAAPTARVRRAQKRREAKAGKVENHIMTTRERLEMIEASRALLRKTAIEEGLIQP